MEKLLDSTQLVSGVAILLSFIAGYRYGIRNVEEQTKTTADESSEKNRVKFTKHKSSILCKNMTDIFLCSIGLFR